MLGRVRYAPHRECASVRAEIFPLNHRSACRSVGLYTKRSLSPARPLMPWSIRESGCIHAGFDPSHGTDKPTRHTPTRHYPHVGESCETLRGSARRLRCRLLSALKNACQFEQCILSVSTCQVALREAQDYKKALVVRQKLVL